MCVCVEGFPHKCQLVTKGLNISHRRTGGALSEMPGLDL